eukprot:5688708-Pleurochrysis_carterae.AAC.1
MEEASTKKSPTRTAKFASASTSQAAFPDATRRNLHAYTQVSARALSPSYAHAPSLSPAQLSDLFGPPAPNDNILQLGGFAADISDTISNWWSAIRRQNADLFNEQEAPPGRSSGSESTAPFLRRSPADS